MFISTDFIYDNIRSEDMGIYLVSIESGMKRQNFGVTQSIREEKVPNKDIPYFFGVDKEVQSIPFTVCKLDGDKIFSYEERTRICRWLCKQSYKPLISNDNPFIIYYAIFTSGESYNNYSDDGYINLEMRLNAPYGFSPIMEEFYDLSDNTTKTTITLENRSNIIEYYKPVIEITLVDVTTEVKLRNISVEGEEFTLQNLQQGETICIDNDREKIKSDKAQYRLNNFNKKWLKLIYGENQIEVTGKCLLRVRLQFPMAL